MKPNIPILFVIDKLRREKEPVTIAFYLYIALVAGLLLLVPLSPAVSKFVMGRFHFRPHSFIGWALLQPIPSMYNFENQVWVNDLEVEGYWIYHYPLRFVTHNRSYRKRFANTPGPTSLIMRSRYQDQEIISRYKIVSGNKTINIYPDGLLE